MYQKYYFKMYDFVFFRKVGGGGQCFRFIRKVNVSDFPIYVKRKGTIFLFHPEIGFITNNFISQPIYFTFFI